MQVDANSTETIPTTADRLQDIILRTRKADAILSTTLAMLEEKTPFTIMMQQLEAIEFALMAAQDQMAMNILALSSLRDAEARHG